jgi:hypothetical protein
MVHGDGENYLKGMNTMSPLVEIRVRDYCPSKQTDLWACHRMTEDDLFMLQDNKFAIGEVYRKLKNDIEAMKEQNKKEVLDSIMTKAKKYWEEFGDDFLLSQGVPKL